MSSSNKQAFAKRPVRLLGALLLGLSLPLAAIAQRPVINSFSPTSGPVGTVVSLTGLRFTGASSVTFNNIPATSYTVNSATSITATVPTGASTGRIRVTTPSGTDASTGNFTVLPPPTISSLTPTSGAPGTAVVIRGDGFTGASSVTFNGTAATFSVANDGRINATVPAGATTGPVQVTTGVGTASSSTNFTVVPAPPTIASFTPTAGGTGTVVTITGTNFTSVSDVTFRNVSATSFTVNSPTSITATVPATATGRIRVITAGGIAVSATNFTFVNAPTLTSFAPTSGGTGASITIQGTGFATASAVSFNGTAATFTVNSGRRITAIVPAGASSGPITVTTAGGSATSATNFTIVSNAPTIASFSPTSGVRPPGPPAQGTLVTVDGTNFVNGGTQVFFNGTVATTINFINSTRVRVRVPSGATSGPLSVTTANGTAVGALPFIVTNTTNALPTITQISARQACANQTITINYVVNDAETPDNDLVVTGSSTDGGSVLSLTADVTGTGANRTATIDAVDPVNGGSASVTLTVTDGIGQTATTTFTVTFDPIISANAGPDQTLMANQAVALSGSVTGTSLTQWTTSGTGTFDDATAASTNYNPSFQDYITGSVTLTLTTQASGNTCGNASNQMVLTFTRPDLVVTGAENVSGAYHNVLVQGGGAATITGGLNVSGAMVIQADGSLAFDGSCPLITGSGSFELEAGATLLICHPQGIAASGPSGQIRVTGTRSFSGGAAYRYNGTSGAQQSGSGLPAVLTNSLTVENAAGVDLSQNVGIKGTLVVDGGDLRQGDGAVTILSDASGTGMVVNFTGVVQGTATVQRYIDPTFSAGLGYRHLSSPVVSTPVFDLATSGFTPVVNAAYNLASNPLLVRPYPTIFGYDESRSPSSSDFQRGYFSPGALTDALVAGRGYSVYMAGGLKPDFSGTLNNGNVSQMLSRTGNFSGNTQKSGWHLLGNPYPSPIDWKAVTIPAGMSSSVSVYRSTGGANGSYVVYTNGIGGTQLIGIAQGFFVRALQNGVNFTLTNACRVTEYADAPVYRAAPETRPVLGLTLAKPNAPAVEVTEAYLYFQEGATAGLDEAFDGFRPGRNVGVPTLALPVAGEELAINSLAPEALQQGVRQSLLVDVPAAGRYELGVKQLENISTEVALYDAVTNTTLPLTAETTYGFTATTAGEQAGRFSLVIGKPAPVTAEQLTLYPNPAKASVRIAGATGATVEVIDALGRVVRTQPAAAGAETVVSLAGVPAGVYSVRVGGQTTRLVIE